ncbi:MAG: oligosaccharide flippase family protein [Clostridia bacterium]|nr:oligosaccharide flippase family protein [Clostridia bacterium]
MFGFKKKGKKITGEGFMQGVIALMFSQVIIKLLGLVYKWYLTNREGFGDKGNAIYSAGFGIYALLLTISSTGVPNAVAKLVSEHNAKGDYRGAHRIFKISLATFAVIGLIGTLILFFGAHYISNAWLAIPEAELTLVALSPAIFFVSIISVFRGYFNGRENMKATANSQTLEQLCKTIFTVLVVEIVAIGSGINTNLMAAGANLATTLATVGSFLYLYLYYKTRRKDLGNEIVSSNNYPTKNVWGTVKSILMVSFPMSLSAILTSINRNIDSMTVKRGLENFLSQGEALKQYGILSGKVDTLTSLPLSFNIAFATALVPTVASAKTKGDMSTANKRVSFSLLVTMLIGLPCMVGMMVFAQQILDLIFPNANEGALIFQISSLAIIFTVLEQTVNGALQGLGRIYVPTIALLIGVTVKCILNLVLVPIPEIGAAGAAFATAACHAIAFLIGFNVLRANMKLDLSFSKFIVKPVLATGMMAICSYAVYFLISRIHPGNMVTLIAILVAVIIYVLAVIALNIFTQDEILMIPYGQKIYKILKKIGIYKDEVNSLK